MTYTLPTNDLDLPGPRTADDELPVVFQDAPLVVQRERGISTVAVVGLGYVGLPTALALHAAGGRVLGLEISAARVADIRTGDVDLLSSDHSRLLEALQRDGM